jgi:hypothetical protein
LQRLSEDHFPAGERGTGGQFNETRENFGSILSLFAAGFNAWLPQAEWLNADHAGCKLGEEVRRGARRADGEMLAAGGAGGAGLTCVGCAVGVSGDLALQKALMRTDLAVATTGTG